jgi:hypothetical protein
MLALNRSLLNRNIFYIDRVDVLHFSFVSWHDKRVIGFIGSLVINTDELNKNVQVKKLYYDGQSVGHSALSGTHLGPATNFSYSFFGYFFKTV